jgi:hypothetical protein
MGFFVSGPYPFSQTLSPNPHKGGWEGSLRGGPGELPSPGPPLKIFSSKP